MKEKTTVAAAPAKQEAVNNPSHYSPNGVDSFMHMKDQMGPDAFAGFLQGNVIKYAQRYAFKFKPSEDLCKAAFYLFHLAFEAADKGGVSQEEVANKLLGTLYHAASHYGMAMQAGVK